MRVGQTSFIVFASKLFGSIIGFVATLTFARILGAEIIGIYSVITAVVSWLKLGGDLGVSNAISKRISEAEDQHEYFTAGLITITAFAVLASLLVIILRDHVDAYIGVEAWYYVILLAFTSLFSTFTTSVLKGERKVHIAGLLSPVHLTVSSLAQIGLVLAGFGLTGMIVGFFLGKVIVVITGLGFISIGLQRPARRHFKRLYDFAKYSWLGSLKLRSFNNVDILVLAAFVPSSLVGVYAVAWSLSKFLTLFAAAVRNAIFPEISYSDATGNTDRISHLTTDSLSYIGLIAIPGLFGGLILGDRLLQLYGSEFTQGTAVLAVLILSTLIYSYQQQILGIIKGIDRPEIAFNINAVFIVSNFVLNVVLVLWIGWLGAAIATAVSAFIGLVLAFIALQKLINFDIPVREPAYQFGAALLMAGVVAAVRYWIESWHSTPSNSLLVGGLVLLGASVYFLVLLAVSGRFRETIVSNSPVQVPFIQ